MTATRIRSAGRWAAFVAAYALVFNVILTSALLATISPTQANAAHEFCLNGGPAVPDANGNSDPAKPIVRCPLCLSNAVATADQPPQTPALAIRIARRILFETPSRDHLTVRHAESDHQPRGPPHLS
jgi:hypothetical protein